MGNSKNYKQKKTNEDDCDIDGECCCIIAIFMVVLIFMLSILSYIIGEELPRPPLKTLELKIKSLSVTPFNFSPSASEISADWNVTFYFRKGDGRPNITAVFYDGVQASIYYKNLLLVNATMDPIYLLDNLNWVPVEANFSGRSIGVEKWASYGMAAESSQNGWVRFNLKVEARVYLNPGTKSEENMSLSFYCNDMKAKQINKNYESGYEKNDGERDGSIDWRDAIIDCEVMLEHTNSTLLYEM